MPNFGESAHTAGSSNGSASGSMLGSTSSMGLVSGSALALGLGSSLGMALGLHSSSNSASSSGSTSSSSSRLPNRMSQSSSAMAIKRPASTTDLSGMAASTSGALTSAPVARRRRVDDDVTHAISVAPYGTILQSVANSRLLTEMRQLVAAPVALCRASPREDNIFHWTVVIAGPPDTVYEGGTFFVELNFTDRYPFQAPRVVFLTRIYHCNINSQGKVCMDPILRGWTSCMTISTVLQSLVSLLYACNPADALVPYIAEQYVKHPEEYDKMARIWTQRYAS